MRHRCHMCAAEWNDYEGSESRCLVCGQTASPIYVHPLADLLDVT